MKVKDSPVAVMVVSPSHRKLAREATKRVKKFLGLDVQQIPCSNKDGFKTKLEIDKHVGRRPVLVMDADLWFVRPWKAEEVMGTAMWLGCHESAVWNPASFCYKDCHENGLDRFRYINTGLFVCDLRRQEHREVFKWARNSFRSVRTKTHDSTDQYHLNRALLRANAPISFLHPKYAFYTLSTVWGQYPFIPREIVGVHAAGVPLKMKYKVLTAESSLFGRSHHPMCRDAVDWHFAKTHEIP